MELFLLESEMNQLSVINSASMNSMQIAGLLESRHDDVKRSIDRLAAKGVIVQPPTADVQGNDSLGRQRSVQVYVFSGEQGKRDSIIIVAQLSPEFTALLVDRWQELEKKNAFVVPTTLSGALRLAAEQAEVIESQQAALALAAPKVDFVDRYVESTGNKGFREVCKLIKANEREFRAFLIEKKIAYRLGGSMTPTAQHLDAGRFEVKTGSSDDGHAYNQMKFTPKGINWIAGEWAKYQLSIQGETE